MHGPQLYDCTAHYLPDNSSLLGILDIHLGHLGHGTGPRMKRVAPYFRHEMDGVSPATRGGHAGDCVAAAAATPIQVAIGSYTHGTVTRTWVLTLVTINSEGEQNNTD